MPRITDLSFDDLMKACDDQLKKDKERISNFVSKMFKKPEKMTEDNDVVTSYSGEKMSGAELVLWSTSPKFTKQSDEKGRTKNLEYFVHSDADNPHVTAFSLYATSKEMCEEMCNIARVEQLPVYGLFNGMPVYADPTSSPKNVYKISEDVSNAFRKTYSSAFKELKESLGEHSRYVEVSDYLKAKEFVKKNPSFPFHPALIAYGKTYAANLSQEGENVAALVRQVGRNPKVTAAFLKCMEPGEYFSEPLVFNKEKVKSLADSYVESRTKQNPIGAVHRER